MLMRRASYSGFRVRWHSRCHTRADAFAPTPVGDPLSAKENISGRTPHRGPQAVHRKPGTVFHRQWSLRSGFGFDDLIKRVAMGALEMDCRGSDHDMSPCPDVSDAIYFPAPEATNPIVHRGGKRHLGIGQTLVFHNLCTGNVVLMRPWDF